MLGGQGASWVGMSVQNEFLGDELERFCHCLNLDLTSVTILTFPHGNSKGEESVHEDVWRLDFTGGIVIEPAMRLPCLPIAEMLGSIHCRSANCFPRRVSKTLDLRSQRGTATSVHRFLMLQTRSHNWARYRLQIIAGCCHRSGGGASIHRLLWGGLPRHIWFWGRTWPGLVFRNLGFFAWARLTWIGGWQRLVVG
jgi:hypothetical protein